MSDGHRLAQLMRQAGKPPQNEIVDIVVGEVTSIKPLKVKVENRELTESFLIVGALCKETRLNDIKFTVPEHSHNIPESITDTYSIYGPDADTGHHSHKVPSVTISADAVPLSIDVVLWRGLHVGDRVLMLKVGRGQKYYIIQREEGVS